MRERASKEVEGIPEDDTQGGPLAYTHTHIHEHAHTHKREGGVKTFRDSGKQRTQ